MENSKNIGIWMDHTEAIFVELKKETEQRTIDCDFSYDEKEEVLKRSEKTMHNKVQQKHSLYYSKIADEILKYDHVLLFGPTNAKTELHNYLNKDLHFKDIVIDVIPSDKMTENEKYAFVHDHFKPNEARNVAP